MEGSGMGATAERVRKELSKLTGLAPAGLIGISTEGGEMKVTLEMVEKKSIPDSQDVLGVYEVKLTREGEIREFTRTQLRKRADVSFQV